MKLTSDRDHATVAAHEAARRLIRWAARRQAEDRCLHLSPGSRTAIAELDNYHGFGDGWALPDNSGIWTQGVRSELAVALNGAGEGALLAIGVGDLCLEAGGSIRVEVLADGQRIAAREFSEEHWWSAPAAAARSVSPRIARLVKLILPASVANRLHALYLRMMSARVRGAVSRLAEIDWRIEVPAGVAARRSTELAFEIDEPRTPRAVGWSADDERLLGFHLRSVMLQSKPVSESVSSSVERHSP